jgi:hypothetical protein
VEIAILVALIWIGPAASLLCHAPPTAAGWLVALTAPVVLLLADACDKWRRSMRRLGGPAVWGRKSQDIVT